jgi:hypothetical protein
MPFYKKKKGSLKNAVVTSFLSLVSAPLLIAIISGAETRDKKLVAIQYSFN